MKKLFLGASIAMLLMLGGSASAQGAATKKIKIGVTMPTADHGWMGGGNWWAKRAMDDWKKKDPNVEFVFKDGKGYDPKKLIDSVKGLVGSR